MLSVNVTIHNKEALVQELLERIKKYTRTTYELVLVLDGCTDRSIEFVDKWVISNPKVKTKVLYADNVFETKSNNIAARASDGDYIAIIQDDMLVNEDGWDLRMLMPFTTFGDVFSVTSKTTHNWIFNDKSVYLNAEKIPPGVWSDILMHVDHAQRDNTPRDAFEIRSTSNRGPLVINHSDFESLDYFDEDFAPGDMDDHDLHFRMNKILGKVTGIYWVDIISDLKWGGTRENGMTKQWFLNANHRSQRLIYERHLDSLSLRIKESRKI